MFPNLQKGVEHSFPTPGNLQKGVEHSFPMQGNHKKGLEHSFPTPGNHKKGLEHSFPTSGYLQKDVGYSFALRRRSGEALVTHCNIVIYPPPITTNAILIRHLLVLRFGNMQVERYIIGGLRL